MKYRRITSRCFISFPFHRLKQELDFVLANRLQPEISLEGDCLYTTSIQEFKEIAAALAATGLACTLHAPFFDLAPGALDEKILAASRAKLELAARLISVFRPVSMVCHLGYEKNKHSYKEEAWFAASLATWRKLLALAQSGGAIFMLENTYESDPVRHQRMFTALASPMAGFCFDVGHTMAFGKSPWQDWFPAMAPWLGQLHLHDNHGERDEHLAPGRGDFDFAGFFAYLRDNGLNPIITLEPHSETDLWESLEALDRMDIMNSTF